MTLDPNEFINTFYKKYTGSLPTSQQSEYISGVIGTVDDISFKLPEVTAEDVKVPERQAINRLKKMYGGLGFDFDQAGMGIDKVVIITAATDDTLTAGDGVLSIEWLQKINDTN